ncbi:MAG: putative O-glycosylation ligase, exosortase A system-associated [Novosphingobium sp.]
MLDLGLAIFLAIFLGLGIRRPFLWVLTYLYVDILSPQKISWSLLTTLPVSLIVFVAAFAGWLFVDDKKGANFGFRQALMLILLIYCGITTIGADFPVEAASKWDWVWKALFFAIFLPLALRTRLRIEATALVMVLSAGAIIICGGIKTALGGGGYGMLKFFVNDNLGLYEGSTLSTVAIAIIPLIVWLAKYGTIYPKGKPVTLFAAALVFACLLIPIGTQTRTGLVCIALLAVMSLRGVKRRFLYIATVGLLVVIAIPLLPDSYTKRMNTIENHQSDTSASTRVAVWKWTVAYAGEHPFGGGFNAFLSNKIVIERRSVENSGSVATVDVDTTTDKGRAYHSAYFEMLGEQGWPGLFIWLLLHGLGLIQLEGVQRRLRKSDDAKDLCDASLASALQQGHIIYLVGALFVGIAYQPFVYMLIGLQIALVEQVKRRRRRPLLRPGELLKKATAARADALASGQAPA